LADVCNYHPATSYYLRYGAARVSKRLTDGTAAQQSRAAPYQSSLLRFNFQ